MRDVQEPARWQHAKGGSHTFRPHVVALGRIGHQNTHLTMRLSGATQILLYLQCP